MQLRPIDIARKINISTSTLRSYEELGLIPPVLRSQSGYRLLNEEHMAYFICIREMLHGFTLSEIGDMLRPVMAHNIDEALWLANQAQVNLRNDKIVCGNIRKRFLQKTKMVRKAQEFSIDAVSKATGVIPSTIRYWDKIGLISASRCSTNNYRKFTPANIDEILILQALKLATQARGEKYAVEQVRMELEQFEFSDTNRISAIVSGIERHLATLNRGQLRGISALYKLCTQVEQKQF